jgi:hypothetical protein
MKTLIYVLALWFYFLFSGKAAAQTIALVTSQGKLVLSSTRADPPVNIIEAGELADIRELVIINENTMQPESDHLIISFTLTVIKPEGNVNLEAKGNSLTEDMKLQLQKLRSGDRVYFEYIKSKYTNNTVRSLAALAFKIK